MRKINIRGKEFKVTEVQDRFWDEVESGKWEPETFDVLDTFIESGKTFIDIGAWNGVCSIYAHSLGADVECVEPDSGIESTLERNIYSNCKRYNIWECAISNNDLNDTLRCSGSFGDSMSSLVKRSNESGHYLNVKSYTLESFLSIAMIKPSDICLIKIDIEGGEVLVLPQAKEFLSKHKPTIYISLHPAWFPNPKQDMQNIIDIIFPIYRVCRMIDGAVTQYSRDKFLQAVEQGFHSWILIAK